MGPGGGGVVEAFTHTNKAESRWEGKQHLARADRWTLGSGAVGAGQGWGCGEGAWGAGQRRGASMLGGQGEGQQSQHASSVPGTTEAQVSQTQPALREHTQSRGGRPRGHVTSSRGTEERLPEDEVRAPASGQPSVRPQA